MPPYRVNLTGNKYGNLVVLRFSRRKNSVSYWKCRCSCGSVKEYAASNLQGNRSLQCLECARENFRNSSRTHGACKTKEYAYWQHLLRRTNGRDEICDKWKTYEGFISDIKEIPKNKRLRQIDTAKKLGPKNYRWVDIGRGSGRGRILLTHKGKTQSLSAWAIEIGISVQGLRYRLTKMSVEKALSHSISNRGINESTN